MVIPPHRIMIVGMKMDGCVLTRMRLLGISNTTYEMKNITRTMEYSVDETPRSSIIPATFAFPMLVMVSHAVSRG